MAWHYLTVTYDCRVLEPGPKVTWEKEHAKKLNSLGSDEWELVSAVPVNEEGLLQAIVYILKRPDDFADAPAR